MSNLSNELEKILKKNTDVSIKSLIDDFGYSSFSFLLLLLLAVPALPLPTGGITHIFELIGIFLSFEIIFGRKTVWLPNKLLSKKIPKKFLQKGLVSLIHLINWLEKHSKRREFSFMENSLFIKSAGLVFLVFCIFAFLAPPFSGLDTLPALGVVILSIGLMSKDIIICLIGMAVGISGIATILALGKVVFSLF